MEVLPGLSKWHCLQLESVVCVDSVFQDAASSSERLGGSFQQVNPTAFMSLPAHPCLLRPHGELPQAVPMVQSHIRAGSKEA